MSEVDLTQLAIDRSQPPLRQHRRHWLTRYILPFSLIAGFMALLGWFSRDLLFPPEQVTVVPILAVQAELREEGAILFQAAGWIEPRPTMVRVAALAPGVVEKLLVVEDQAVRAGEPVAELVKADAKLAYERALADRRLRQAELEEAEATLTAATTRFEQPVHLQAALGQADAALAEVETELAGLPFELRRAEAQLVFTQKSYDGKMAAGNAVSGRVLDSAKNQVDSANALVEQLRGRNVALARQQTAMRQRRDALRQQLKLLAEEIQARDEATAQTKASAARVELADVQVQTAQLQLDRMTIRAPIDGRVFQLLGHPGTRLNSLANSTVVTMYRPDSLQVRVDVRFEDIPKISLGQPVLIRNPMLTEPLTGSVLFTSSEADIQKNTLEVKVAIPSPPPAFKPDMLVDVAFLQPAGLDTPATLDKTMRLYLPQQLIHQKDGESFVWLADQSQQVARMQVVTTGARGTGGLVEIVDGLTITSRIIQQGSNQLRHGCRIRITGEEPSSNTPGGETPENRT